MQASKQTKIEKNEGCFFSDSSETINPSETSFLLAY
jgi:hypothetical protein